MADIVRAFEPLFRPARYKIFKGGRGGAKSWNLARALAIIAARDKVRILATRELQNAISDSVYKLLCDQIEALRLGYYYTITQSSIRSRCGSEFLFKGLRHNAQEIKSTEGIDIAWIEEAQKTSKESLELLRPTIRKANSELWFSLNPDEESDPVYQLAMNPPTGAIVRHVNYYDNPFFPAELERERLDCLSLVTSAPTESARTQAQADYDNIWLGMPKRRADAAILKRWEVQEFETPERCRFFHGADWGFAADPTALVRAFILDNTLYIDQEAFGHGVEIDDLPALFDKIPTARDWPIKADAARPETISYMRRQGFNIAAAEKWQGSVEDGIAHLNGFKKIVVHPRCANVLRECKLYSYKVDRITGEILPIIVDANNHGIDAIRYSLDGYILKRGGLGVWSRLAD